MTYSQKILQHSNAKQAEAVIFDELFVSTIRCVLRGVVEITVAIQSGIQDGHRLK